MRIGLIFTDRDVESLKTRNLHAVLIAPGCPINESQIAQILKVKIFNLNDQIEKGAMAPMSRDCARFIRAALHDVDLPPEAVSSQNDIYQYHLRKQYLFYSALKQFLDSDIVEPTKLTLVFPFASMAYYESPLRPELNILFNDFRTWGYLSQKLTSSRGIESEYSDHNFSFMTRITDALLFLMRENTLKAFVLYKLFKKVSSAKPKKMSAAATVGIVVRTDSEVISAAALVERLVVAQIKVVIIKDELLASETTAQRLQALGLEYVSVGAALGFRGLFAATFFWTTKLRKRIAAAIADNLSFEESFMDIPSAQWAGWMSNRLLDFSRLQRHFAAELRAIIRTQDLKLLITFAYVDQWGPVIQQAGANECITTICIQNAAQDPEEYPKLAWADHYCVESQYLKNRLVELDYPIDRITATGLPHYTDGLKSNLSLTPTAQKPSILVITQPIYSEYYIDLLEWLGPFCARSGCELHIKYHPRQLGNEYANILAKVAGICPVKVYHRESIEVSLGKARLCISVVSAAILKAINLGVPTISFLPKSEKFLDLYYCSDENLFVTETFSELEVVLNQSIYDFPSFWKEFLNRRQKYLNNHLVTEPSSDSKENIFGVIISHLHKDNNLGGN